MASGTSPKSDLTTGLKEDIVEPLSGSLDNSSKTDKSTSPAWNEDKSKNAQEVQPIESPVSLFSPKPQTTYSPNIEYNVKYIELKNLLEEIIQSESTYCSLLDIFLRYYIFPMSQSPNTKYTMAVPFQQISYTINELLKLHQPLASMNSNIGQSTLLKEILSKLTDIADHHYLYVEYCCIYEDVVQLSNELNQPNVFNFKALLESLNHYLEATQPLGKRQDLSFLSLVQKPIARLGKYRLFLESLAKQSLKGNEMIIQDQIVAILTLFKHKLEIINSETKNGETSLDKLLSKSLGIEKLNISHYFFGKPLLVGLFLCVWMEEETINSSQLAVFLFKSHLICSTVHLLQSHLSAVYVLPLTQCVLQTNNSDYSGGLFSDYEFSFKILFEKSKSHYELLAANISQPEYDVWVSTLQVLINFVNGPCKMDYKSEDSHLIMVFPEAQIPYDIFLEVTDIKIRRKCYYKRTILVAIQNFEQPKDDATNCNFEVNLSKRSRVKVQKRLVYLWSSQLPRIIHDPLIIRSKSSKEITKSPSPNIHRSLSSPDVLNIIDYYIDLTTKSPSRPNSSSKQARNSSFRSAVANLLRGTSTNDKNV